MAHLLGCICNQPERLCDALEPVRDALLVAPPVVRWGLGYIQGGEVLLSRTPRRSENPVDFFAMLQRIQSDYIIAHAAPGDGLAGNTNTQPFRYRRWLFAQQGQLADPAQITELRDALLDQVPPFLRRNVHGKTIGEHVFHQFLSVLHSRNSIEDLHLPLDTSRESIYQAVTRVRRALDAVGAGQALDNLIVSNGRSLLAARLSRPLYMRPLALPDPDGKTQFDHDFRGVLVVSAHTSPGPGFEEIPVHSAIMVSRDVRIELAALDA